MMAFINPSPGLPRHRKQSAFPSRAKRGALSYWRSRSSVVRATISEKPRVAGGGITPSSDQFNIYNGFDVDGFVRLASKPGVRMVPIWQKVFADQLTPVMAFRCLVPDTDLTTPSFLLETVPTPEQTGRYSLLGTKPICDVVAYAHDITITTYNKDGSTASRDVRRSDDPWDLIREMSEHFHPATPTELPGGEYFFNGGWVGYGGYDAMRYAELKSLPFSNAPTDDRNLPDLHFGLYVDVVIFDHLTKVIYIVHWVDLQQSLPSNTSSPPPVPVLLDVHNNAMRHLDSVVNVIMRAALLTPLAPGRVSINTNAAATAAVCKSNLTKEQFMGALNRIHEHICEGDTFQTVFSQRFERKSSASPFSTYRALRIINPSPYMIYMQCQGCILVASSPEILTRVVDRTLTNRPLAGTRRRGTTEEEDIALAEELLADDKDNSEHMMLVDLGRNDVGKVSQYGTVIPERVMEIERYSHVMHISSTITGKLRDEYTSWDALRATLPAGTISGAPKIRSMQIIDDLEPTKRGPYGGGIGYVSFHDTMNIALALRTMVIPTEPRVDPESGVREWTYYLQAGAGIVFQSDPEAEYRETVNKAMALNRAIDLAENAFGN